MSDKMEPIRFENLVKWIISEYKADKTIFGIPMQKFYRLTGRASEEIFGELLESPVGPAAGPHTQLTQNIIAAYLTGGRFFELKTVQTLDDLKIDKPCIDASDEGYNVEWSQELSLDQSYAEYVKAWILIHLLKNLLGLSDSERGFVFNMSVGYDLEGIMTGTMDRFIEELKDASKNGIFAEYKEYLLGYLVSETTIKILQEDFGIPQERLNLIISGIGKISPFISNSVTLSTMHGCPPREIESIVKYLL